MVFNQNSYKTLSQLSATTYLRKSGGENVTNTETFFGGIKTDTVKDVAGNSLLTKTGLGANVVSSSLTSVGNLSSLTVNSTTDGANTISSTAAAPAVGVLKLLAPNQNSVGRATYLNFGQATSAKNAAELKFIYAGSGSDSNKLSFSFYGVSNANYFNMLADGKVGIGTDTPSTALQVNGTVTSTGLTSSGACYLGGPYPNQMVEIASAPDLAYIDFHSKASNTGKRDARIISSGGTVGSDEKADLAVAANSLSLPSTKIGGSPSFFKIDFGDIAGGFSTTDVNFNVSFTSAPKVFCTVASTNTAQIYGIVVNNVSASKFTYIKTYLPLNGNAGGGAVNEAFSWMAIGP
jgi:hypothetical protein